MPTRLMSRSIPNLVNGVSQQPASLRLASQSLIEKNRMTSVVDGNKRRPPSEYVAKLSTGTLGDAHIHTINKDTSNRYIAVFGVNGALTVNDVDGTTETVTFADYTRTLLDDKEATATATGVQIYIPTAESTITLTTSGITTATVIWEKADDDAFTVNVSTLRTDTSNTDATVAWTPGTDNGKYVRARISAYTSGTIDATMTWKDIKYLQTVAPSTDLRTITVADFTFIVNKQTTCGLLEDLSPANSSEALVSVKQASYQTDYDIYIDTVLQATFTTGSSGALSTVAVATNLEADLNAALTGYTIARQGSSIRVVKDDGTDFAIKVVDSKGGDHLNLAKGTVQEFSDLPKVAPNGFKVKVLGDAGDGADDYYVKFVANNANTDFDEGQWEETVAGSIVYRLDPMNMPHAVVQLTNGNFEYRALTFGERSSGDLETNKNPSFIDNTINDVFLFKNRLGFLSDDNVIMSEVSEFFSFFRQTVVSTLDSDRIDVAASTNKVSILRHAVPYSQSLLLFSDQTQFRLEGGEVLSSETVSINPTTEYEASLIASPFEMGSSVFFAANRGSFSSIREYIAQGDSSVDDAAEVTAHVPSYVPTGVQKLAGSPNNNLLAVLTTGSTELCMYRFYYVGDKKLQSAWTKWDFNDVTILNVDFIESTLFLVMQYDDAVYLEKIDVEDGRKDETVGDPLTGARMLYHLDRRITEAQCSSVTYSAVTNKTTFTLPWNVDVSMNYTVVTREYSGQDAGVVAQGVTPVATNTITVTDDWSTSKVYIGQNYTSDYVFSPIYVREPNKGGGETVILEGRLGINHVTFSFSSTAFFQVVVDPTHADASTHTFTGRITGDASNIIGTIAIGDGEFRVPVMAENTKVEVKITTSSFLPATFTSAEWEGRFTIRSRRG